MNKHILIVEDEKDLLTTLEYNFKKEGYKTTGVTSGKEAIEAVHNKKPDLLILDLMLPDISGLDVCKEIRNKSNNEDIFILMLTAKGEEVDRIVGFELGADDYLVKPFSLRELSLRVSSLLKRSRPHLSNEKVSIGELEIDIAAHRILLNNKEISLTKKEFELIMHLVQRNGRVQTREHLLSQIWGYTSDVTTRTVDTHIKRLRSKLGSFGKNIETVRSVGYRFNYKD
tara:strand:+ start:51 stop:734 length:684 start_codon:yes stop_codon:yes gene_type:complete